MKKRGKVALLLALSVLLILMSCLAAFWEPIMDLLPIDRSGWKTRDGILCYWNEDGDAVTGWQDIEGVRYYFSPENGGVCTGWQKIDGETYYLKEQGGVHTGWLTQEEKSWFFDDSGCMKTGWLEDGDDRYYLNESGNPVSGWQEVNGVRYCFSEDGKVLSGWQQFETGRYYLNQDGSVYTGWLDTEEGRYYLDENGTMATGWVETEEGKYYLSEDGLPVSGWLKLDGIFYRLKEDGSLYSGWLEQDSGKFYIQENGTPLLGWLELDGQKYYLDPQTGTAVVGKKIIDGVTCYFTSTGANVYLVNPWNYLPEDYEVELVKLSDGHEIAAVMQEPLEKMLADCEAAGHKTFLRSAYRTQSHQRSLYNNMVEKCGGNKAKAATIVALPGTSEHQLGLAVDITDYSYRDLNSAQEKTQTQQWLMEHCWEYGFILRYPNEKSAITGIIYEPWHYRYVGTELSMELKELGICLEEYLDMLTGDGTTCGGT